MNGKEIYCDLVFPLRLGVLTYKVPLELKDKLLPGMVVEAPLRRRLRRGIVLRLRDQFHGGALDLKGIVFRTPILNKELLDLLEWASGYYLSEEGIVLKSMVPSFIFKKKRLELQEIPSSAFSLKPLTNTSYSATLVMEDILKTGRLSRLLQEFGTCGVIIIVPSIEMAETVRDILLPQYKERLILYHSKLGQKGLKKNYIALLNASPQDGPIVIGTRSALFLPFKPSGIIILDESSHSYKQEESPYLNTRDVAVMRAYLENIPIYLCSELPSIESFYNAKIGKYRLIESEGRVKNNRHIIINRIRKGISTREVNILSERLIKEINDLLKKDQRVLLLLPRTGYSIIYCSDCGRVLRCECEGILVYYRNQKRLRCRVCENQIEVPFLCPYCNGSGLEHRSIGIERVKEILSCIKGEKSEMEGQDSIMIALSSKKRPSGDLFSLAVMLDADIILNMPDYRAGERLFQEVFLLRDQVKPDGKIIVQTRVPEHEIFKYIRNLDYKGFAISELRLRRLHRLPPYGRLILIRIYSKRQINQEEILQRLHAIPSCSVRDLKVKRRKKGSAFQTGFLLRLKKGSGMKELQEIIALLKGDGMDIRCEVDPL
jgi:primosomal protein N' (replication factor Y)